MPTILGEEDLFKTFQGYSRGQSKHIARRAAKLAGDQNMEVQTADIWGNNQKGLFQHQSIGGICTKITDCKFDLVRAQHILIQHPSFLVPQSCS